MVWVEWKRRVNRLKGEEVNEVWYSALEAERYVRDLSCGLRKHCCGLTKLLELNCRSTCRGWRDVD